MHVVHQALYLCLYEESTQHLAYEVFGKLSTKLDLPWNFVGIQAFAAESQ